MLNTSANKAIYGGISVPLTYIIAKTLLWLAPSLATLLTEEYLTMFQAAATGLVVWLVPNKGDSNANT